MIAQHFRQLNVHCLHLYFIKAAPDINGCVFKYRECKVIQLVLDIEVPAQANIDKKHILAVNLTQHGGGSYILTLNISAD